MRSYDNNFRIDGKPILSPDAGIELSQSDLDSEDTGRDESGIMHRIVVREKVKTWSLSYSVLTAEEYTYLKNLFAGKSTFAWAYLDEDGTQKTTTAYCSKNSLIIHLPGLFKNLKFNIIEC